VISACRVGNARVVGFMGQRWESALDRSARKLSALYTQGYTLATDGADALLGKVIVLAGTAVHRAAANASQFQKKTGVKVAAVKRVTPFRKARARKASWATTAATCRAGQGAPVW
jgi:hypothetical protein